MILPLLLVALSPEQRAIDYLLEEVPKWYRENRCYSCHNDGDGARALFRARKLGYLVPDHAVANTKAWLENPGRWDTNRGNPAFSDKKLARIQFAAALLESGANGRALNQAARLLVEDQEPDGSWQIDTTSPAGSPVTWGTVLASFQAGMILNAGHAPSAAQSRLKKWLDRRQPQSVPDTAALILAGIRRDELASGLLLIQTSDGGWGPQKGVRAEAFDTALVLLALAELPPTNESLAAIERGRKFLIGMQLSSGGWPATTRPAGSDSYAQHVSTTAWAAMALMATDPERQRH